MEVWVGTAHFTPGTPVAQYEVEVHDHFSRLPRDALQVVFQGDVNTGFSWALEGAEVSAVAKEGKGNVLHKVMMEEGFAIGAPGRDQVHVPTSRPRQAGKSGQCIDIMAYRGMCFRSWGMVVDSYLSIGTDHELCRAVFAEKTHRSFPRHNTRPRVWVGGISVVENMNQETIEQLAQQCTRPAPGLGYKDPVAVKQAFKEAKLSGTSVKWKMALKLRKEARLHWEHARLVRASEGEWHSFRALKPRRQEGWDVGFAEAQDEDPHQTVHEHLQGVYAGNDLPPPPVWKGDVCAFTLEELRLGLTQLKRGMAVGADLTSTELLQGLVQVPGGETHLLEWYNRILATQSIPSRWNEPVLVMLPKMTIPKRARDLRPIAMGSAVSKLFSRMLLNRALSKIVPHTYAQCSGPGRQTSDYLFSIIRLFELTREWGNPLVVFKLDSEKAFDSLDRQMLMIKLEEKLGQGPELNCWHGLLRGTTGLLQTPWGSSKVEMRRGIKQGGIESPLFFAHIAELVLTDTVSMHGWRNMTPLYPDLPPEEMLYMDDGMLWSGFLSVVQARAQTLSVEFAKYGLRMNPQKCQLYASPHVTGKHEIVLNGVRVQASPTLEVMGLSLRVGMSIYEVVSPAVSRARAKFWELKHLFRAKGHMKSRARVMQRVVGATALWYVCAVPPDKAAMTALNATQLQLMVWLLRFSKASTESWGEFRQRAFRGARSALHSAGLERWSTLWLRRYWRYAGHRVRSVLSPFPPISCDFEFFRTLPWWTHQQTLKQGGLRHKGHHYARLTLLEQHLDSVAGAPWRNLAHDRCAWRGREDAWVALMDVPWSSGIMARHVFWAAAYALMATLLWAAPKDGPSQLAAPASIPRSSLWASSVTSTTAEDSMTSNSQASTNAALAASSTFLESSSETTPGAASVALGDNQSAPPAALEDEDPSPPAGGADSAVCLPGVRIEYPDAPLNDMILRPVDDNLFENEPVSCDLPERAECPHLVPASGNATAGAASSSARPNVQMDSSSQTVAPDCAWITSAVAQLRQLRLQGQGGDLVWLCVLRRVQFRDDRGYFQWFRTFARGLRREFGRELHHGSCTRSATRAEVSWASRVEYAAFQDYVEIGESIFPTTWSPITTLPSDVWIPRPAEAGQPSSIPHGLFRPVQVAVVEGVDGNQELPQPSVTAACSGTSVTASEVEGAMEETDEIGLLEFAVPAWMMVVVPGAKGFHEAWTPDTVPPWFEDVVERLQLALDRGFECRPLLNMVQDCIHDIADDRFAMECEPQFNLLLRRLLEYSPILDDPVIQGMGEPGLDELEELVEWSVGRVRHHWLWSVCPVAMRNRIYEVAMRNLGYTVTMPHRGLEEEDRERRQLSRSRTPQRQRGGGIGRAMPANVGTPIEGVVPGPAHEPREEGDETALFQDAPRMRWPDLIEQLGRWFEEGRAVGMAVCMARRLARGRDDRSYREWVEGPLATIGAGYPNSEGEELSETPRCFFEWARAVEGHLYEGYQHDRDIRIDIPVPSAGTGAADAVSLMENRWRHGRRRVRDSRSPRRQPRRSEPVRTRGGDVRDGRGDGRGRSDRLSCATPYRSEAMTRGSGSAGVAAGTGRASEYVEVEVAPNDTERASGSTDPAPTAVRLRPNQLDVTQPMTLAQAVTLWKYLLFDRGAFQGPREGEGRIPLSFLPRPMLREVSATHEAMPPTNRAISTLALVHLLRYLMAELSQTLDVADAVARTREGTADAVDLEEDDEPALMQTFFATGGVDSMAQRWARAMVRLQKELSGFMPAKRGRMLLRLRSGLPAMGSSQTPSSWQEQFQALLLVMGEDISVGSSCEDVAGDAGWLASWTKELAAFLPGYSMTQTATVLVDSLDSKQLTKEAEEEARDMEQLLRDEEEERQWKRDKATQEEEEMQKFEEQEQLFLRGEAAAYQAWEDEQMKDSACAVARSAKRRCLVALQASVGTSQGALGHRTSRMLEMELPLNGTPLVLTMVANMEDAPSEVPTVRVQQTQQGGTGGAASAGDLAMRGDRPIGVGAAVGDFEAYARLYAQWRSGATSLLEVASEYGQETVELLEAQYALEMEIDKPDPLLSSLEIGAAESGRTAQQSDSVPAVVPGLGCPGRPRLGFGFFENIYEQWRCRVKTDGEVVCHYGHRWLKLFRQWRTWGLSGIWCYLSDLLDMEMNPDPLSARPRIDDGDLLPRVYLVPVEALWEMFVRWQSGEVTDTVRELLGTEWLRIFEVMATEGIGVAKPMMEHLVNWQAVGDMPMEGLRVLGLNVDVNGLQMEETVLPHGHAPQLPGGHAHLDGFSAVVAVDGDESEMLGTGQEEEGDPQVGTGNGL
ncbi:unnamed protein product [Symbiodinium sp. CCMP2456]|nr:unnamed protein product [Symbiodinium sp. CCMP2456]